MDDPLIQKLTAALPAAPGIMGREEYFQAAVLVPLVRLGEEYGILFQKRAAAIRQGGEISFPGGRFDAGGDRSFRETAVRETCEELGLEPDRIRIIGRADTLLTPMEVLVEPYIGILEIEGPECLRLNRAEVEEVFILPLSELRRRPPESYWVRLEAHSHTVDPESGKREIHFPGRELELPERYHGSWGDRKHRLWAYRTEKGVIWGITAQILRDILNRLPPPPENGGPPE